MRGILVPRLIGQVSALLGEQELELMHGAFALPYQQSFHPRGYNNETSYSGMGIPFSSTDTDIY
jgi:hypothetical protein